MRGLNIFSFFGGTFFLSTGRTFGKAPAKLHDGKAESDCSSKIYG
jgi:hypothetical protein